LAATYSPAKQPENDVLFSTLYSELHRLARRQLAGQFIPARLGATTLLHEAYLNMAKGADPVNPRELALINDALEELTTVEPDLATLVDLKFFCGFSFAEIGAMQMISERTVQRKWEKARIYLHQSIGGRPRHD
jgi:hypothetical protein